MPKENPPAPDLWAEFQHELQSELEQSTSALKEITLMLDQSRVELTRLTQRNAAITGHLQQVQSQLSSLPREEILTAYAEALDAQQRLLVMRGQLEKLQGDQAGLLRHLDFLDKVASVCFSDAASPFKASSGKNSFSTLQMIIEAQEGERKHLSRQMHDGPAQALSNFIVQVEIANRLLDLDPARAKEELANLKKSAMSTFQKVRSFIFDLHPMMLDDLGLVPTLRRYTESLGDQAGPEVVLTVEGAERRLPPFIEVMIFRSVQELVENAMHHNQDLPGKLQILCQMQMEENEVLINVSDNGKGISEEPPGESKDGGINRIQQRIEMLGGSLKITSTPGKGSVLTLRIPGFESVLPSAHY